MSNRSRNYIHRRKGRKQPEVQYVLVKEKSAEKGRHLLAAKAIMVLTIIALAIYVYVNRGAIWQSVTPTLSNLGQLGILWGGLGCIFGIVLKAPKVQGYSVALLLIGGVLASLA